MENNAITSTDRPAKSRRNDDDGKLMPDYEAHLRHKCQEMGYTDGKAFVHTIHDADKSKHDLIQKPGAQFFADLALRYEIKANRHIAALKEESVKKGASADNLKNVDTQEKYAGGIGAELESLEKSEFYSKSLGIYLMLAVLLSFGDMLMGDYLAKEVLKVANYVELKSILFGLFCIALGVIVEVVINSLYNRVNKTAFNAVIVVIPVLAILMFIGMGVLRPVAMTIQFKSLQMGKSPFPPWAMYFFFIGLSIAAPAALGCVLFIIQKKIKLNLKEKKLKFILNRLGDIINAERLLEKNKSHLSKDLSADYDLGYQQGTRELILTPPKVEESPRQSLQAKLKAGILKRHGLNVFLALLLGSLFVSCNSKSGESLSGNNTAVYCQVYQGLNQQQALTVLQHAEAIVDEGGSMAVIWPGGIEMQTIRPLPKASMLSQAAATKTALAANRKAIRNLAKRVELRYLPYADSGTGGWKRDTYRLLAQVSEHIQGRLKQKRVDYWLASLPAELLQKNDSLISTEARADARYLAHAFTLHTHFLTGAVINLYLPSGNSQHAQQAEWLRRTLHYYRQLLLSFGAIVVNLQVKAI